MTLKIKYVRIILIVVLGALAARDGNAQNAGAFARVGMGARGISMGNALVADAGGGQANAYYNPALAPYNKAQHVDLSAGLLSFDRQLQFVQFTTPLEPSAGVSAGLIHSGVSEIDGRNASGLHTKDYSIDEYSLFLDFGVRVFDRFSIGAGFQLFRANYTEDVDPVTTIGIDAGMTARVTPNLRLGLALDDLLARYAWDTSGSASTTDRFPRRLRIGAAYKRGRVRLTAEYESRFTSRQGQGKRTVLVGDVPLEGTDSKRYTVQDNRLRLGAEIQLAKPLSVRAGADRLLRGAVGEIIPSAGLAVVQPIGELRVRGSYAFRLAPYAVGATHFITMQVYF